MAADLLSIGRKPRKAGWSDRRSGSPCDTGFLATTFDYQNGGMVGKPRAPGHPESVGKLYGLNCEIVLIS